MSPHESEPGKPLVEPVVSGAGVSWRRKLYDWAIHWANTPYGAVALFFLAVAESSFFPIPPDVLLIALVLARPNRWVWLATLCTIGSVVGGIAGYFIGFGLMESVGQRILDFYNASEQFERVKDLYIRYDYWIVFSAAFTPIPYKVFTITSGVMEMNIVGFLLASAVGRGARFFIVSSLLYWFGEPMKRFIDRYFNWLAIAVVVAAILGFAVLGYL